MESKFLLSIFIFLQHRQNEINTRGKKKKIKSEISSEMIQNLNQDISDSTFSLLKIESNIPIHFFYF